MPSIGQVNNPAGTNSWQGFGAEQPYGAITQQNRLAAASQLAGGKLSAGAINAPKKAQADAKRKPPKRRPPRGLPPVTNPEPPPGGIWGAPPGNPPWMDQYPPGTIQNKTPARDVWTAIASTPGAARYPILQLMALRA